MADSTIPAAQARVTCATSHPEIALGPVVASDTDAERAELLGRARAVPVYFPAPPARGELRPKAQRLRAELERSHDPAHTISEILRETRADKSLRREIFLSRGYLYEASPSVGFRVSQALRLDHLFSEKELTVQRGAELIRVRRHEDRYETEAGAEARLLLFDRVQLATEQPGPPLHVDFRALARRLGFRRLEVLRSGPAGLWVRFHYGQEAAAQVSVEGAVGVGPDGAAELLCEDVPPGKEPDLSRARELGERWQRVLLPLQQAINDLVELRLPFDEPKTEFGQEDGKLRAEFVRAYREGRDVYQYNGDEYPVFDGLGRARLPEVCVDFITDVFDRATGGSWAPKGKGRKRVKGALHLGSYTVENARSVESLLTFAATHPETFDTYRFAEADRVPFRNRERFFAHLVAHRGEFQVGDVLFIYGLRDDERNHYHSFFIRETDPVTGIPIFLAANAGVPELRSWEGEMGNAPRRSLVARWRVRLEVLEKAYLQAQSAPGTPLELPGLELKGP